MPLLLNKEPCQSIVSGMSKKFKTADEEYLRKRKLISKEYGPREMWSLIDHWPLYAGVRNISRFLITYELVKQTMDVPGHIAEFGSWKGANLMLMAKILRILDPHGFKVTYCFETFEGLAQFHKKDKDATQFKNGWKGSLEELQDMISLYGMEDNIEIVKGYIEKTLPKLLRANKALSFSLVYCDTDLYGPTKVILDQLHPRLMKGGIFVFDEWNQDDLPGEGVAVSEFLKRHGDYYSSESVRFTRKPSLILRKVK